MPDSYKVIILPEAQEDIRKIVHYIARSLSAPQAALNLSKAFQREIRSLSKMPKRFAVIDAPPWKEAGIRRFTVKNYYVYYLLDEEEQTVKIIAVIYTGRDQERQFS